MHLHRAASGRIRLAVGSLLVCLWALPAMSDQAAEGRSRPVRIAAAQPKARLVDYKLQDSSNVLMQVEQNLVELEKLIARAAAEHCDAVALPEDTLGLGKWQAAHPEALAQMLPAAVDRMLERLSRAAASHRIYVVCCNDTATREGILHNTAFLISREGKLLGRYDKVNMPIHELSKARGNAFPVFKTPDLGDVGMLICYDMVFPEAARALALGGADIIFHSTLGGAAIGDDDISRAAFRTRAVENFVYLVVSQRGSGSMIISPQGKVLAEAKGPDELAIAELDPRGGREGGDAMNFQTDMRSRLFRERSPAAFGILTDPNPPVLAKIPETMTPAEAVAISERALTIGEEQFREASQLARAGKTNEAAAAFQRLRREYRQTWIDRVSAERLTALGIKTDAQAQQDSGLTSLDNRAIQYTVPASHYVVLKRGPIQAVVVDNRAVDDAVLPGHRAGYHGVASLTHDKQPRNLFVPAYAGLNFEHIHDGTTQAREILFEPRNAPMQLRVVNEHTAELYQPPTPHWGLESCLRYELQEDGAIRMIFECIPRRVTWKNDYLGLFWASYIHQPESLDIHFLGQEAGGAAGWIRGSSPEHGVRATHLAVADDREFAHDADFPLTLVFNRSDYRFTEPWYFGMCRGMAFAQSFRPDDHVRISQSPSGGGAGNPAWDFQWLIREPKVGQRCQLVMHALYVPAAQSLPDTRDSLAHRVRRLASASAAAELASKTGLAARYPGDRGIERDPHVLFAENFETGTVSEIGKRWGEISNQDGQVITLTDDVAAMSQGKRSLQLTATLGLNTGGHLFTRLKREADRVFARFYVKFPDQAAYIHHFVTLGGYRPATAWPQGGAGVRPRGDERFTAGIEPYGNYGRFPAPGAWNFYAYWAEMKGSADGKFWGNSLTPSKPALVPQNRWQCVEVMLQCNSATNKADGELALWLDGQPIVHFKPGVARNRWTGMGFSLTDQGGEPFEGFRWRTNDELKVNFFWLLHYVTENAARQNRLNEPNPVNRVRFDDIVVSTEYVGPIAPVP